ncbi:MAG TPA: GxGYxYP domain-containing protein [Ktedonobacteraceae bacterium]|jgi:hypothetical protein|nr:GxGYxYP domain-containing protein [Ktedonobacteraceae bacterium]
MHNLTTLNSSTWETNKLIPASKAPSHLQVYDILHASYDEQLAITTFAGLVNRRQPQVYLLANDDAASWLETTLSHVPREVAATKDGDVLEALLETYRERCEGLIIYDPNIIDSVNVATTMAGLFDGIVVSAQQAELLQKRGMPVLADLRRYQWRNRLAAYHWATQHLLRRASKQLVAGINPRIPGALRSFLVANRAFVYWLNPRPALPGIRNGFHTERGVMRNILNHFEPGTPHFGWLVDEGFGVRMTSKAALPVIPSDYFFNLEVWSAIQPQVGQTPQVRTQNTPTESSPAIKSEAKVYVSFTISDGDNLQYSQHKMHKHWQDPARGKFPLGWTISPVLTQAAPSLAAYYQQSATNNDELIAGPSGAGYIVPSRWPGKYLPNFFDLTGKLMQVMGLSILTALDATQDMMFQNVGLQEQYVQGLKPYGLRGILSGSGQTKSSYRIIQGIPVIQNLGLAKSVEHTLQLIHGAPSPQATTPQFLSVYIHAWSMTPSDIQKAIAALGNQYIVVKPGQLLDLIAETSR